MTIETIDLYDISITDNSCFVFSGAHGKKWEVRMNNLYLEKKHAFYVDVVIDDEYGTDRVKMIQIEAPHCNCWQFKEGNRELYGKALKLCDYRVSSSELHIDEDSREYIEVKPLWFVEWWVDDDFSLVATGATHCDDTARLYNFNKKISA